MEFFDGMLRDDEDRGADIASVRALLDIVREHVGAAGSAELYPVWQGDEKKAPKGVITMAVDQLVAERFFFVERFLYRIVREEPSAR